MIQDKERRKIEEELGAQIQERERKFSMMKEVLEQDAPTPKPRGFKTPAPAKTRTYTTPGTKCGCLVNYWRIGHMKWFSVMTKGISWW